MMLILPCAMVGIAIGSVLWGRGPAGERRRREQLKARAAPPAPPKPPRPLPRYPRLAVRMAQRQVSCIAFSPDGKYIAVGDAGDFTIKLLETSSGREVMQYRGHGDAVWAVAFSADGRWLLTGSADNTARTWSVAQGIECDTLSGHTAQVVTAGFANKALRIVTGSFDGSARVWSLGSAVEQARFADIHGGGAVAALTPDGWRVALAAGSRQCEVCIFDVDTKQPWGRLHGHALPVQWMEFSPDGKQLLTRSSGELMLWDIETGSRLACFEFSGATVRANFYADGVRLLIHDDDGAVKIWDLLSRREIRKLQLPPMKVTCEEMSADGRWLAVGVFNQGLTLWDLETGKPAWPSARQADNAMSLAFSPDGGRLLAGCLDNSIRVWDLRGANAGSHLAGLFPRAGAEAEMEPDGWVVAVAWNADGTEALAASSKTIRRWNVSSPAEPRLIARAAVDRKTAAFSLDGKRAITADSGKTARVWNTETAAEVCSLEAAGEIGAVGLSADGAIALTYDFAQELRAWDIRTGQLIWRMAEQPPCTTRIEISRDDAIALIGCDDRSARLVDLRNGRELHRLEGHAGAVQGCAFSADGKTALTASTDGTARLWDVQTGKELHCLRGHDARLWGGCFSPDGRRVAAASDNAMLRLWDATTGAALCTMIGFKDGAWAVFDEEGRYDSSNGGDLDALHWVKENLTAADLSELKGTHYTPGLLSKLMGF